MAKSLCLATYTREAWAAQVHNPQNRVGAIRPAGERAHFEMPDQVRMAALALPSDSRLPEQYDDYEWCVYTDRYSSGPSPAPAGSGHRNAAGDCLVLGRVSGMGRAYCGYHATIITAGRSSAH